MTPEPFRLRFVEGAHHLVERGVPSREPQLGTAAVAAKIVEEQVDHDIDGLAQCLCPGFGQCGPDEPVQLTQVSLQQFGVDLVPVGEVVVHRRDRDAGALAGSLKSGGLVALLGEERLGGVEDGLPALHAAALDRRSGRGPACRISIEHDSRSYQRGGLSSARIWHTRNNS